MTDYKILFLDVDGTILQPDNTIENSTKEAIQKVQEKGLEVFIATGRPLHELDDLAKELNIHSFIGYNGASAVSKGRDIFQEWMDGNTVQRFLDIAQTNDHEMILYTNERNLFTSMDSPIVKRFMKSFHLYMNDLYSPSFINQILGITLMNVKEDELKLYDAEGIHLSQVSVNGIENCYDVIRDKVNKGIGVQEIMKQLGIHQEQSIAFGDGMNDKEMLESVGEGFAMGNAHPDLFSFAKHRTTEVTNSGIYNGLKKLGLMD